MSLDRARLRQSIANNLERIFTSREMHAPAQLDYGMPDPNTILHAAEGSADLMRRRLKDCVEAYEPRLLSVRVLQIDSVDIGTKMHFSIHATLVSDPPESISLDASIEATGRIRVTA